MGTRALDEKRAGASVFHRVLTMQTLSQPSPPPLLAHPVRMLTAAASATPPPCPSLPALPLPLPLPLPPIPLPLPLPQMAYRLFLEALANRDILVVATPYRWAEGAGRGR